MAKGKDKPTFEEALKRLETIVEQLEDPDVTLDQTLDLFQEGKRLSEICGKQLTAVEQRVSKLLEKAGGELALGEFEEADEEKD